MKVRRWVSNGATIAAVLLWIIFLRPGYMGGPAGYVIVSGESMEPGLMTGDLVVTQAQGDYAVGDVVAFRVPSGEPGAGATVIHRIIGGSPGSGYRTQGDNRETPDLWRPGIDEISGRMWFHLPGFGRFMVGLTSPLAMAGLAGGVAFLVSLTMYRREESARTR